ncbi:alpha-catenin [Oopsacas minuta]|uniref:Alpha-catenin n=1 Tax=Oopsacas minuta TaxID=111878 RepID=A0A2P1GIX0_9METZ|nr:alpha-catenin [Oopsacas minuta]KAI6661776.1 alpha-catenin [Oopsacas minuta]
MSLSFYHGEEFSSFGSLGSNPSTCSTRSNLSQRVELVIAPLIEELISVSPSSRESVCKLDGTKKQNNISVSLLLQSLDQAVSSLVHTAEIIAYENDKKVRRKMLNAVNRLKTSAKQLSQLMSDNIPPSPTHCIDTEKSPSLRDVARVLLYDVACVLSVADKVDERKLQEATQSIESCLDSLRDVVSLTELYQQITQFTPVMARLAKLAKQRQNELDCCEDNSCLVESLSWHRRVLTIGCAMLISSCKCYVRHPDIETARINRDFSFDVILESSNIIARIMGDNYVPPDFTLETGGAFYQQITSFQILTLMPPEDSTTLKQTADIQHILRYLIDTSDSITELVSTRPKHSRMLKLFRVQTKQYLDNSDKISDLLSHGNDLAEMCGSLCHAIDLSNLDALLDLYSQLREPLQEIRTAVRAVDFLKVQEAFDSFFQLMERILQVSDNISSSCSDPQSTRLIRLSTDQLTRLATQLTSAARSSWQRQNSRAAWNCFEAVTQLWQQELTLLLDSLDSVVSLSDFLSVVELHLQQHLANSVAAVEKCDVSIVAVCRSGIQTVCSRILCIIEGFLTDGDVDMELYIQQNVNSLISVLRGELYKFDEEMNFIELSLSDSRSSYENIESYKEITDKIFGIVTSIKNILVGLMSEESELSVCERIHDISQQNTIAIQDNNNEMRRTSYRRVSRSRTPPPRGRDTEVQIILNSLPPPEKHRLESARQEFHIHQVKLESAVSKWDETENDVIFLAKDMCVMMMDISDFTKSEGPIHKPYDLIQTANKLATSSQQLESLITNIIENCNEENSIKDLQAYLGETKLYSHQIKMTSKVYKDLNRIKHNTDSLSSIVISSKNLLNTVVKLVMLSYIACNKIVKSAGSKGSMLGLVKWKIRPPNKKPLCRSSSAYSLSSSTSHASRPGTGRLSSTQRIKAPVQVLDEFEVQLNEKIAFL